MSLRVRCGGPRGACPALPRALNQLLTCRSTWRRRRTYARFYKHLSQPVPGPAARHRVKGKERFMTRLQAAFDILGVSPDSDAATVKKAWRALVRTYHPDMARTDREAATRRLAAINAAFDAIGASTEAERRSLAEAIARRRLAEEAARRARARAHAQAQRRESDAARAAKPGERATAEATARARAASACSAGGAERPRTGSAPAGSAGPDGDHATWDLARKAARAFQAAREVCSREIRPEPLSVCF